ncbi:hypothetical protein ACWCXH_30725 [Kitasatospora sp. NPDC001660]
MSHVEPSHVEHGITEVTIATLLNRVFTASVQRALAGDVRLVDTRRHLGAGRAAPAAEVARLLTVLRAAQA